jgi:hypothetical protein
MVYLPPPENAFFLFAGGNLTAPLSDTWMFNVTTGSWSQFVTPVHPLGRVLAATAEVPGQDGFYVFSGANATGNVANIISKKYYSDMWYFSPTSGWKNMTRSVSPPSRFGAMMAFSGENSSLVMSGGLGVINGQTLPYYDTWLYSTTSGNWTELTNNTLGISTFPTNSPTLGCGYYDPISNKADYIGGSGFLGSTNSTWDWDALSGWQQVPPANVPPTTVTGTGCSFDGALDGAVLFGGLELNIFGSPRYTQEDSTYLVRYADWGLSAVASRVLVAGASFNVSAYLAGGKGLNGNVDITLTLNDSSGTLTPKVLALVNGTGQTSVVVWRSDPSDTLRACGWDVCANLTVDVHASPARVSASFSSSVVAGQPLNVTIDVLNSTGALVPWWNGTATIETVPGSQVYDVSVNDGIGKLPLTLQNAGTYSLFAEAPGLSSSSGTFEVTPGPLASIALRLSASSATPGSQVAIGISTVDQFGNPVAVSALNLSDTLGDIGPKTLTVPVTGMLNVTLQIGNRSGNDTISVSGDGVHGTAFLTVASSPVPPAKKTSTGSVAIPAWEIELMVAGIAAVLAVVGLLYYRRRKGQKVREREKKEHPPSPPAPAYLGFLPFKEEENEDDK